MEKITQILERKFTHSVELVPPRNGAHLNKIHDTLSQLKEVGVDFISCTKGAGGSLRAGTLPITYYAHAQYDIPSIAHFTCRQINKFEVENSLVDMAYLGVTNVLALRGDPPDGAQDNDWDGEYSYAHQLVSQIAQLNQGNFIGRAGKDPDGIRTGEAHDFCIGVAAHPNDSPETRVAHLKKKVEEGAQFAITQMVFDAQVYKEFVEQARNEGITIPIIPGIWPLNTEKKLRAPEEKFGLTLPSALKDRFKDAKTKEDFETAGIAATVDLCKELKEAGAPGIHLFIFQNARLAAKIFELLK